MGESYRIASLPDGVRPGMIPDRTPTDLQEEQP